MLSLRKDTTRTKDRTDSVPLGKWLRQNEVEPDPKTIAETGSWRAFLLHIVLSPCACFFVGVFFLLYSEDRPNANLVPRRHADPNDDWVWRLHGNGVRLFIALYSLCVLAILSYYINLIMSRMVAWESDCVRAHLRQMQASMGSAGFDQEAKEKYGSLNVVVAHVLMLFCVIIYGMVFFRSLEYCSCSYGISAVEGCVEKDFKTCAQTGGFVKTWIDVFYMPEITLSTIGFGDYQPRTWWGRFFGIFWMLCGVTTTAVAVSQLSSLMFEIGEIKTFAAADAVSNINCQVFNKIGKDKSGTLSRGEFLTYTLIKYNLVEENCMADINALYDQLDAERSNSVSCERILR